MDDLFGLKALSTIIPTFCGVYFLGLTPLSVMISK